MENDEASTPPPTAVPLKPFRTILDEEVQQAVHELKRPAPGLIISGLLAGFGIGTSLFAVAAVVGVLAGDLSDGWLRILAANAYTVGFIIVILGNTDLFTEYTTMALLPVLEGKAAARDLVRLWGLIYLANLVGGGVFVLLMLTLGGHLDVIRPEIWVERASRLTQHPGWIILLSGGLAGWLMGMLSWLITAARETISQILFVWLITGVIAIGHLHHCISGTMEVAAAVLSSVAVAPADLAHFLVWTTAGNVMGAFLFALLIHYSELIGDGAKGGAPARSTRRSSDH